jgi:hypothetical protein
VEDGKKDGKRERKKERKKHKDSSEASSLSPVVVKLHPDVIPAHG